MGDGGGRGIPRHRSRSPQSSGPLKADPGGLGNPPGLLENRDDTHPIHSRFVQEVSIGGCPQLPLSRVDIVEIQPLRPIHHDDHPK